MSNQKTPIPEETLFKIPKLHAQGMSFRAIARELKIGESTVRKYRDFDGRIEVEGYRFTKRQIEIAIAVAEKNARK